LLSAHGVSWQRHTRQYQGCDGDSAEVAKMLNSAEFDTVIGKIRFDGKGDPTLRPYAVYRWSNRTYEQIEEQA
jgi:ABC-type branched-subunit amino acid transport system substrate-binding protein